MSLLLIIIILIVLFGGGGFYGFRSGSLNSVNLLYILLALFLVLAIFGYVGHGVYY